MRRGEERGGGTDIESESLDHPGIDRREHRIKVRNGDRVAPLHKVSSALARRCLPRWGGRILSTEGTRPRGSGLERRRLL
jgi:hypothetical protein